jgi:hypothetical protein
MAMRTMTIFAIITTLGLGMLDARAQTTPQPQPQAQPELPSQSPQPSTSGRSPPQAPTGHRQPRAADVPKQGETSIGRGEMELDQKTKICRGC